MLQKKKTRFIVSYYIDVNGTKYEKEVPVMAFNSDKAQQSVENSLKKFPETEYKITAVNPA